jgi:uncharacterized protein YecE (DUF72 family)
MRTLSIPPFVYKNLELLERISSQIDNHFLNVLEFRHESWWSTEVYDFLEKKGLVFCSVSASGLPERLVKTADSVYVRFHGKDGLYQDYYADDDLKAWAEKIKQSSAKQILCYFNNDVNAKQ